MQRLSEKEWFKTVRDKSNGLIGIFGAGYYGTILLNVCKNNNIRVDKFLVSDTSQNDKVIAGIPVESITSLGSEAKDILILIAVKGQPGREIEYSLTENGYTHYMSFPEWLDNYNSKRRFPLPIIEVTPVIGCAVNCKYCPQQLLIKKYYENDKNRRRVMEYDDYIRVVEWMPREAIFDFSGFVEPFFHPRAIEMMEFTVKNGHKITLFTTLRGLDSNNAERVIKIPFDHVTLHIADSEGNSQIIVDEDYLSVLDLFVRSRKQNGTKLVDAFSCHGTVHPQVKAVLEKHHIRANFNTQMMDRAGNLNQSEEMLTVKRTVKDKIRCSRAKNFDHNVLLPDGTLVLCCNDYGMKHVLGNLFEQQYEDVMSGKEKTRILQSADGVLGDEDSLLCRNCVYAYEEQ